MEIHMEGERFKVFLLSSSLLTDRMILFTDFLRTLCKKCDVKVFVKSSELEKNWALVDVEGFGVAKYPKILPFKEFPYNYPLRRLNDLVWDYRLKSSSRLSILRLVRRPNWNVQMRILAKLAKILSLFPIEKELEAVVERCLLSYSRSPEGEKLLQSEAPDVVVSMRPHFYEDPAVVMAAKKLKIPVLAFITSWDNVTTKHRLVFQYDGYIVWSEQMKNELLHHYPCAKTRPVYVVGAPQFDVFFQKRFQMNRDDFCFSQGIDSRMPYILYALGSPNFIPGEWYGAYFLAQRIERGELGDIQMIIRPHPLFDDGQLQDRFKEFYPRVVVQKTGQADLPGNVRSQDETQVREWVNTFRHASVVINFASTATVDAAIVDRPVVNLDFDPEPGQPHQELVREVNHVWSHFKPIAESGGVWQVHDMDELVMAVNTYLRQPDLHRAKRRWIAEHVCGYVDGQCGNRFAQAIIDFLAGR